MDETTIDYSYISFYFFIIKYEDRLCDHSLYDYEHNNKVKLSKWSEDAIKSGQFSVYVLAWPITVLWHNAGSRAT